MSLFGPDASAEGAAIYRQAEFRIHQRRPNIEPQWVKRLKKRAVELARSTAASPVPLCLMVDFSANSGQGPSVFEDPGPYVTEQCALPATHKLVLVIDRNGRVLKTVIRDWDESPNWDPVWAAMISEENGAVVFHVYGISLIIYESGVPMEEIWDVWRPKYPFVAKSDRHHEAHEFSALVRRHFEDFVQYHRVVVYWKDRANRIFVGGPEKIFQRSLWWYLDEFLLDHRDVSMEHPPGGLTDRTDIWIETVHDEQYLLEIKWLGRSTSGPYGDDQAMAGARQTIVYLTRFPRIKRAALVMYDGRTDDKDILWTDKETHPKLDVSLRLFIESKTASEIGRKR